jgi:AbrB family looped-hinge helix DNA binding protein
MPLARSKVTSRGQISIPLEVRKKLGIGPGSILEWQEQGNNVIVRRSGAFSSQDIHKTLFGGEKAQHRTIEELKAGIRKYVRRRHARG